MTSNARRGRPPKQKEDAAETETHGQYEVTKPGDSYVVKLGDNVVYADPSHDKIKEYLALVSR